MASKLAFNLNFSDLQDQLLGQFRDLDPKDPSSWPTFPRYALFTVVAVLVVVVLWFLWLNTSEAALETEKAKETTLRE